MQVNCTKMSNKYMNKKWRTFHHKTPSHEVHISPSGYLLPVFFDCNFYVKIKFLEAGMVV